MGSSLSASSSAEERSLLEIEHVKKRILRKCDCYVSSIEHTNSVVDVKLETLRDEISATIKPLHELKEIQELGMLGMAAILEDIEKFANAHREIIQLLLDILHETQPIFEEITSNCLWPKESNENDNSPIFFDEICMTEIRGAIEKIVTDYAQKLEDFPIADEIKSKRCEEFQRLLFKLGESTVSEGVSDFVFELKAAAIEEIDRDLTEDMLSGEFSNPEYVKAALQHIMTKSIITRNTLEALPFSRREELEAVQDEISTHVDQLIRRIQLNYVHSPESLKIVMNLQSSDLEEGNGYHLENGTNDNNASENDDDEDIDEQSTVVEKLDSSDDESHDGREQETETQLDEIQLDQETEQVSARYYEQEITEEELKESEEIGEQLSQIDNLITTDHLEEQEEHVLTAIQTVKDKIENLKHVLGPFSQVESYSYSSSGLSGLDPSPYKTASSLLSTEIGLLGSDGLIINLAEESEVEQDKQQTSNKEETQIDDANQESYSQLTQQETQDEAETKRGLRRKTVELPNKKRTRKHDQSSQHRDESEQSESDTSQISYSLRKRDPNHSTTHYSTVAGLETKRRRTRNALDEDGEVSASESVSSSTTGRKSRGPSRF